MNKEKRRTALGKVLKAHEKEVEEVEEVGVLQFVEAVERDIGDDLKRVDHHLGRGLERFQLLGGESSQNRKESESTESLEYRSSTQELT